MRALMRFAPLLALLSCDTVDVVEGYVDDGRSTVYVCDGINAAGQSNEWCYFGTAEELEQLVPDAYECHASGLFDRTSLVGCWWHCTDAPGCNAHNGCAGCAP